MLAPVDSLTVNLGCVDEFKRALMKTDQIQQKTSSSSHVADPEGAGNIASALTSWSQSLSMTSEPTGFHRVQSLIYKSGDDGDRQFPTYNLC